jgi:hypothetical protein
MYVLFIQIIGCLVLTTSRRLVSVSLMCYKLQGDSFKRQPNVRNVNDVQQDSTTYSTGDYARGSHIVQRLNYLERIMAPMLAGPVTTTHSSFTHSRN